MKDNDMNNQNLYLHLYNYINNILIILVKLEK